MHNCSGMLCKVGPCFQARKILLFFTLVWEVLVLVSCRSCPRIGCKCHESRFFFTIFQCEKGQQVIFTGGEVRKSFSILLKNMLFYVSKNQNHLFGENFKRGRLISGGISLDLPYEKKTPQPNRL